jgi:hypothetical protein
MTTGDTAGIQLNRAYVEGKVIASNLEHLRGVLSEADVDLRNDLKSLTKRFAEYVGRLNDASTTAAAQERATSARQDRPGALAGRA